MRWCPHWESYRDNASGACRVFGTNAITCSVLVSHLP